MANANAAKTSKCGTLEYTKLGLIALFGWLLWGDFCYTIMEAVVPSLVPLKLKSLNCPNWVMGMIISVIIFSLGKWKKKMYASHPEMVNVME